jgi:hypothetical protein
MLTLTHGYMFYSIFTLYLRSILLAYIISLCISVLFHIDFMSEKDLTLFFLSFFVAF